MKRVLAVMALLLVLAAGVLAQGAIDPQAPPTFATVNLQAGFALDPYLLRVESTDATVEAADVSDSCVGVIPEAASVIVNWTGEADQLSFFVYSDTDPVLLIVTPAGDIVCNDDWSLDTLNPVVTIPAPEDGAYAVFVGAYSPDEAAYGWLGITGQAAADIDLAHADLRPMLALAAPPVEPALVLRSPDELQVTDKPIFGQASLVQGFGELRVPASAAGVESASDFYFGDAACTGYINLTPSYRFIYSGEAQALQLFFNGQADASLLVRLPDGRFACSGDAAEGNLNPALLLETAPAGDYTIWLGSSTRFDFAPGELVISEDAAATPDILAPAR